MTLAHIALPAALAAHNLPKLAHRGFENKMYHAVGFDLVWKLDSIVGGSRNGPWSSARVWVARLMRESAQSITVSPACSCFAR